jgi:hypothetical protein
MPGLVPGIHVFLQGEGVDGRDKPGHDDRVSDTVRARLGVIPGEPKAREGDLMQDMARSSLPLAGRGRGGGGGA